MTGVDGTSFHERQLPASASPSGVTYIDAHVKVLNEKVVEHAKRRGMDVLIYAPHFTRIEDARSQATRYSDSTLLIIPAREVFTGSWRNRQHILLVGLETGIPDFITLEAAISAARKQDAAILVPHPLFLNVSLNRPSLQQFESTIHAVERCNYKLPLYANQQAEECYTAYDVSGFGSSYAHLPGSVGAVWTAFNESLDSEAAVVAAFQEMTPRRIQQTDGYAHMMQKYKEFGHFVYENTWQKVDRLVLSGREATHPSHEMYDNRFDEASVY